MIFGGCLAVAMLLSHQPAEANWIKHLLKGGARGSKEAIKQDSGNKDPDTRVPKYSSVAEACKRYIEQRHVLKVIANRVDPIIRLATVRIDLGQISMSDFDKYTREPSRELKNANQRSTAAEVAVLRAAGYSDWKMYSRYSTNGIGDLWNKNVIAGERVSDTENKNHPDHKYTYAGRWRTDVRRMCEPYER